MSYVELYVIPRRLYESVYARANAQEKAIMDELNHRNEGNRENSAKIQQRRNDNVSAGKVGKRKKGKRAHTSGKTSANKRESAFTRALKKVDVLSVWKQKL